MTITSESPEMFSRGNILVVKTFPAGDEFEPKRNYSGRIGWPTGINPAVGKQAVHDEFERQRITGIPYDNDSYARPLFAECTAQWYELLKDYPWVDDVRRITQKQPIRKHLLELQEMMLDFPTHSHLWSEYPAAEHNDFADHLLRHVNQILYYGFPSEFVYRYLYADKPESDRSATAALFNLVNQCLADESRRAKFYT